MCARLLVQRLIEIAPIRVHAVDEADLPGAGPVLHGRLALDRDTDVVVPLVPDEAREAVLLGEPGMTPSRYSHARRARLLVTPR